MKQATAAEIAREALIWLAARPDDLGRFLAETGADASALRAFAAEPESLGFVLDFLLADETLLLSFAADAGVDPGTPGRARQVLPGGALPNWT